MGQKLILAALLLPLAACSSGVGTNPVTGGGTGGGTGGTGGGGITSDRTMPPGTASPSPRNSLYRYEPSDGEGSGYATGFAYDSTNDTFTVDNLAFDGDNSYTRDAVVGSLGPYAVYENANLFNDSTTGAPITQFSHKVLYGVSTNTDGNGDATAEFAIVRTGAYLGYGFGGFIYQRNGGVTLPTSGQARYNGDYAGLRDFDGRGGLEYVTGDMQVAIDFEDFDAGDAVQGRVTNRRIFDTGGTDITNDMLTALAAEYGGSYTALPTLLFTVGPGVLDANGEMLGGLTSQVADGNGDLVDFESGNYYALLSGANADEIVGVLVVEADDPRYNGVTVRETGGFILYRP
ncbi:hypothetical protein [Actibacterium sp. MT2.3-13A]|uniref:hypothetical protein n=1 Tax=Actibacterium sp. MT2.3-13A TaxID=2828332 RepID=UPI001BA6EE3E|nr:hypothetical protein [Actibacterium sp. MT2.3-13A]